MSDWLKTNAPELFCEFPAEVVWMRGIAGLLYVRLIDGTNWSVTSDGQTTLLTSPGQKPEDLQQDEY